MRQARERCESGLYHVVLRGINRQDVFYDNDDFRHFLDTLGQMKSCQEFEVYGYCLMSNHIHLLIREKKDSISRIMSRVGTSYAWWYNRKYGRSGHVFQGRYGSECVKDDKYLLTAIRYIHNNPVKAGMVREPEAYQWSSIHAYYGGGEHPHRLTEPKFVLELIHPEMSKAMQGFRDFMKCENDDVCLDDETKLFKTDGEVRGEIEALMDGDPVGRLHGLERKRRREILKIIKESEGVSLRQIARVTGLGLNVVYKA